MYSDCWHESGNETVAVSTLTLTPSPEDDRQLLKCHVHNPSIPSSGMEDSFPLNVLYPPQVSLQLGSTLNPDDIKEGDDVYFECHVVANPKEHKITWLHENHLLVQNMSVGVIMSTQSLVLQGVTRHDAGNYRCVVANSQGETSSEQVRLRVQFAPVCAGHGEGAALPGGVVVVGASLEERLMVRCDVAADPADVAFVWQFSNSGEGFEVHPGRHASNGTSSVLAYTPRSDHDYGTLSCAGANAIGRQAAPCLFQVVPAGRPSPLSNCTVGNRSAEWLEVDCAPGFDGGLQQVFLLEAYDSRSPRLRANATRRDAPLFRLADLAPGASLRLVLYAVNAKGRSEPTVIEDVSLWDAEKRTDSASSGGAESLGVLPLLALLLGALLALSSVGLVAALAVRRRRLSPGTSGGDSAPAAHLLVNSKVLTVLFSLHLVPRGACRAADATVSPGARGGGGGAGGRGGAKQPRVQGKGGGPGGRGGGTRLG
ncbi:nephrin-like [Ischnura elegans]|uniref:nephrin-like n=1 Tax=Ischnura elegans TaxID=197161 RepID=UPI001ED8B13E|nr:nephrin-like [Ischnura elegans]